MRKFSLCAALALVVVSSASVFRRRSRDERQGELSEGTSRPHGRREGGSPDELGSTAASSVEEGVDQTSSIDPVASTAGPLGGNGGAPALRAPRPAPNRDRPAELWHASLDIGPAVAPATSALGDQLDPTELLGGRPPADHDPTNPSLAVAPGTATGSARPGAGGENEAARAGIRPPTDIFAVAPTVPDLHASVEVDPSADEDSDASGWPTPDRGPASPPVSRRPNRNLMHGSLFGGGAGRPVEPRPEVERITIGEDCSVTDDRGTIRVAEESRSDVVRSATDDSFDLRIGWCWVARAEAAPTARILFSRGVVSIPGATRALVVVETDGSTFVSVVAGEAQVELDGSLVSLTTGSIAHIPVEGDVSVDGASPSEMAADSLLTLNLRLDDARAS